jgi:hypothetical protein
MITCKIDVKKIDKQHLYVGAKCTYLDIALFENKDGQDQYGNDGFVVQSVGKEARDRNERGPIIGNWKQIARKEKRDFGAIQKPDPAAAKPGETHATAEEPPTQVESGELLF